MLNAPQKAYLRHLVNANFDPSVGLSDNKYAELIGVHPNTLGKWKKLDEFCKEYAKRLVEYEQSRDFFKVCVRDSMLEQLIEQYAKAKGAEKRQYLKMLLAQTADIEVSDDTSYYGDLSDDDLIAIVLKREVSMSGLTAGELKTLAETGEK
jgi:hypothetical protein